MKGPEGPSLDLILMSELIALSTPIPVRRSATEILADHRLGFIDGQSASVELRAVKSRNSLVGALFLHDDKSEPLRTARVPIRNDID